MGPTAQSAASRKLGKLLVDQTPNSQLEAYSNPSDGTLQSLVSLFFASQQMQQSLMPTSSSSHQLAHQNFEDNSLRCQTPTSSAQIQKSLFPSQSLTPQKPAHLQR